MACWAYKKGENLPILLFRLLLSLFIDALIIYVLFAYLERLTRSEGIRESVVEEDIWMERENINIRAGWSNLQNYKVICSQSVHEILRG